MGFFDFLNDDGANQKENRKQVREVDRVTDTEFAEESAHLDLREEELDIHKNRVETGDVVLHKDIIEEEQVVNVPVSHDQVVIERRAVANEPSSEPISEEETVHIPVTAETIDVDKHTVVTGEISAHKRSVQETEQVRDVLHKEVADVEVHGDTDIINKE
ncbi:YsnF/AvaK domain-containing protein [Anaerobacillus isosaccharinicus]|uniref:YsnF/AvaK domain-containing protein n=1 Tax=Anaerobacillus isosaccharinicus TaxID=1532552 RepID=A0A1S2MG64_9BACI|nr:YsnF/AvaK domain-containing protein [Anaerobacillus isosaccharinicus]MBA5584021.1 YsnF/AvaK domain-containing protein [Anaerobacillus isosaccharinicus]QOY37564.1 YsnF/AvaK domain-containing protein [Anaerobacillus isosaccharinicus]